jgi:hypothetical protein
VTSSVSPIVNQFTSAYRAGQCVLKCSTKATTTASSFYSTRIHGRAGRERSQAAEFCPAMAIHIEE